MNNLIGISGRAGAGKDLVGRIIQGLATPDKVHRDYYLSRLANTPEEDNYYPYNNPFEVRKFAGPLKNMVCTLIGCTRKQLENREFKETPLKEEWWKYECSWTFSNGGVSKKNETLPYLEYKDHYENGCINQVRDGVVFTARLIQTTPRILLQQLGTECGRDTLHPNIWVNALFSTYDPDNSNWIITDLRFPNELAAIKSRGGVVIRVDREQTTCRNCGVSKPDHFDLAGNNKFRHPYVPVKLHPSETALDNATFDYTINNNGTIAELVEILKELNIVQ